jgi:hypothetical protein
LPSAPGTSFRECRTQMTPLVKSTLSQRESGQIAGPQAKRDPRHQVRAPPRCQLGREQPGDLLQRHRLGAAGSGGATWSATGLYRGQDEALLCQDCNVRLALRRTGLASTDLSLA